MIGQTLSHYLIRERIGAGGMGEVYLADDLALERPVALKFVSPKLIDQPSSRARLKREARVIARLSHPNIARLHELVIEDDRTFLVLEYLEGRTLAERLANEPLPLVDVVHIGIGIAHGLAEAHERGVVHRDVKPGNIMLTDRGTVKILDFGLARGPEVIHAGNPASPDADTPTQEMFKEEGISGTLGYMAPEQLSGAEPDPAADIYALGGILFEMCCRRPPFEETSTAELISAILRDRPPRPGQLNPELPRELERLIEDCLEKDSTYRPNTARSIAEQLEALYRRVERRSSDGPQSLAVLPFVDMSPEKDQDYFCDGITEELILGLSKVANLEVASRTSAFRYRDSALDIRQIGRELGVDALLEGSVRKAGDQVRVTAQLIDVENGYHLWSDRYDRQLRDILSIQDEIARNIVRALEVTLKPGETVPRVSSRAHDADAYDYYLRGRRFYYQYDRRGMELALKMYSLAIEHDEDFALAYTGIANCWSYLFLYADRRAESLHMADQASARALSLNPELPEAHVARGQVLSLAEHHDEAEAEFKEALELDDKLFDAAYLYARDSFAQGKLELAIQLFQRAEDLNPHDYQPAALVAMIHDSLDQPDLATAARRRGVQRVEEHLKQHPGDVRALYMGANCLMVLGDRRRSMEWAKLARSIEPDDPMVLYNIACIYSLGGDIETALDCLTKAVKGGLIQKGWIVNDSNLDPIRAHPAYEALMEWLDEVEGAELE